MRYKNLSLVLTAVTLALLSTPGWAKSVHTKDKQYQPKPNLKIAEKPSQKDQRVVPQPGKPEDKQPPPDIIVPAPDFHPDIPLLPGP